MRLIRASAAALLGLIACGSSPTLGRQFAAAEEIVVRAKQSGAAKVRGATPHLKVAEDTLVDAKTRARSDPSRAASLAARAHAEAQLALALAKESQAVADAQEASDRLALANEGQAVADTQEASDRLATAKGE